MQEAIILPSNELIYYFTHYGYIGIYIFFVTVDQVAPIPEEVTLIVIGYLASLGFLNPFIAGIFCIAAFFTIDAIYFYLTKTGSRLVKKMKQGAEKPALRNYKSKLHKHMFKTILILSFLPRVRLLTPVIVALTELHFKKFVVYSMLSLALFCAVYISLGYAFSKSIETLLQGTGALTHYLFIGAMVALTIALSIIVSRKFKQLTNGNK